MIKAIDFYALSCGSSRKPACNLSETAQRKSQAGCMRWAEKMYARSAEPKETNRQIGPLFRRWLNHNTLGGTDPHRTGISCHG